MFSLVSSKFLAMRNIVLYSVPSEPRYHVQKCSPYNVQYLGAFLDLESDVIYGRSLFRFYENVSPTILKNVVFRLNNNHTS